jgi:hypothetical protein
MFFLSNINLSNKFFLTFKDRKTADVYYRTIYTFPKFLLISMLTNFIIVINNILLEIIEGNENKIRIKNLEKFLLISEGFFIFLFILWKIVTLLTKKEKFFFEVFFFISSMNLFNIFLQPLIKIEILKHIASSVVTNSIIPLIHYSILMIFIFFIENNFIMYFVDFTLSFSLAVIFSIGGHLTVYYYLPIAIYIGSFFFLVFM